MTEYGDGELCVCCTMYLANNERCEQCDHSGYPLMEMLADDIVTLNWGEDFEPSFSWGSCDGCGVVQGGNYYPVAIWEKD